MKSGGVRLPELAQVRKAVKSSSMLTCPARDSRSPHSSRPAWSSRLTNSRGQVTAPVCSRLYTPLLVFSHLNPFTTAGQKTNTIFEFFCHAWYTVSNQLISLKFSKGFVPGLTFLGKLIYLYYSPFYTCLCTPVNVVIKSPKSGVHCYKNFFSF